MRVIVGMTGATGAIYGIRLLEQLRKLNVETHLVLSEWAKRTIALETDYTVEAVEALADRVYDENDQAAAISSGSFRAAGMVIVPCSMKTVAAISHSYNDNLIARAADVTLKEQRKLIVLARETPLNANHLENLLRLANQRALILPPVPAFYNHPKTIDDIVNHAVNRILDHLGLDVSLVERWGED